MFILLTLNKQLLNTYQGASLMAQRVKCLPAKGETRDRSWVGKIPWRRKWQPTPVLLPGKSHGWRSLEGYSPWGRKESDTTERLHFHFSLSLTPTICQKLCQLLCTKFLVYIILYCIFTNSINYLRIQKGHKYFLFTQI